MTKEQFEVIAKLMRSRGKARKAASLVLVDGISNIDAATEVGVGRQAVYNAVTRFKKADTSIRAAYRDKKK